MRGVRFLSWEVEERSCPYGDVRTPTHSGWRGTMARTCPLHLPIAISSLASVQTPQAPLPAARGTSASPGTLWCPLIMTLKLALGTTTCPPAFGRDTCQQLH